MSIHKLDNGRYQVRFAHAGKQYKKNTKTRKEAVAWEADAITKLERHETVSSRPDNRRLSELVDEWFNFHGHSLKTGKSRQTELHAIVKDLGNPVARTFSASDFARYRTEHKDRFKQNTLNHHHVYLSGVFAELIRAGEWRGDNPLKKVKKLKIDAPNTTFLTLEQVDSLLFQCEESRNAQLIAPVKLCLATGARWGEALALEWCNVREDRVTFLATKNGKNRTIPISNETYELLKYKGRKTGRMFDSQLRVAFEGALKRSKIKLPAGQKTHVLRHTFASHFMMGGGDLLTLQKILGHGSLDMVLRYAHLAPEHLEQAREINPLVIPRLDKTKVALISP